MSYPALTVLSDGAKLLVGWFVLLTYQLSQMSLPDDPRLLDLQNKFVLQTYSFWQPGHRKDQRGCGSY